MLPSSSEKYLLDTNVLIYLYDQSSPFHAKAVEIIFQAKKQKLYIAQQNVIEFSNVLRNSYHVDVLSIAQDIQDIVQDFTVIMPGAATVKIFIELLQEKKAISQYVFDLYLAATMLTNGLNYIITANEKDFTEIQGITVYNPWSKQ